jgi:bifunctional UDP-N-acetylglucosamine pyrophosphorylase/glucosamine-1-phosphate N-acetyltransferase
MVYSDVAAVVLAAGRGTRIKTEKDKNKVVLPLNGRPMIGYTVDTLKQLELGQLIVVVGHAQETVRKALGPGVTYAVQQEQLGTGHALEAALPSLKPDVKYVLVVYGDDSAFFPAYILRRVIESCRQSKAAFTFLTLKKADPTAYGRVVRNRAGEVIGIVEERNASEAEKRITEINLGGFCFKREFLEHHIQEIEFNPVAKERYLTDMVAVAVKHGQQVIGVSLDREDFWQGVNTEEELALAHQKMAGRV